MLVDDICRIGSFTREHGPVKEKHKKDKDKHKEHKEKSGKEKSPRGDVLLRSSFSWDASHGEFLAVPLKFVSDSCNAFTLTFVALLSLISHIT